MQFDKYSNPMHVLWTQKYLLKASKDTCNSSSLLIAFNAISSFVDVCLIESQTSCIAISLLCQQHSVLKQSF